MKAPVSFDNFPTFAANGSRDMNPESAKYSVGFVPADTFPAEWANYMFHGATKGVSDLNTAVASIWAENANVLTQAGITPAAENNGQLYSAIMKFINDAVLTANQQVLAQAKLDAHPVGSLYWSSSPTDPATLFGGTWTRIKDRFVLATGDIYPWSGATGGSATVQLTESNLPAHKHYFTPSGTVSSHSHGLNGHSHSFSWNGETADMGPYFHTGYADLRGVEQEGSSTDGFFSITTGASGFGRGHQQGSNVKLKLSINHTHKYSGSGTTDGNSSNTTSVQPSFSGNRSETESSGSQNPFSILPPYIVKYCWERTA